MGPYRLEQLRAMPTIHVGQYDDLKYRDADTKVWLSRLTVEDGQPYDNQVTVEKLIAGRWVTVDEYQAV